MSDKQLVEALNERIKELSCLYEISNIASNSSLTFEKQLQSIINYLPRAWRYPNEAVAELTLDSSSFHSDILPKKSICLRQDIVVNKKKTGWLAIHYNAKEFQESDFLSEERVLLKTLAQEIAGIIEKNEQNERERLLQQKFQHSDRLSILGEMTAGIAHELNTPLGNILGFSQLIEGRATDPQIKKDIEKIINSVMHSREVVKKLMFFSCEMPQQMQLVSVNTLIVDAIELLKFSINNKRLSINFNNSEGEIMVPLDPIQFTQVVFNLLINAIHASKEGSKIIVNLTRNASHVLLEIQDFGHGIKASIKEKIFEPFFSTKTTGEGSGLGLSVVHGIVKSHGGEISVVSEENKGAIFKVKFPFAHD
jgi:two-component system NtrC family sensor kinase